jgi:aminoglycoside phosphotransferase (APT) family kinase protein
MAMLLLAKNHYKKALVTSQTEERIITAALLRMGLIDADEQPHITHLTGGVSSLIVRVDTRRGPLCVKQALPELKVATHWSAPLERSHAELAWIAHVSKDLPEAVPTILGSDPSSFCFAMNWLPPESYPVWKLQLRDGVADSIFSAEVGRRLAAIHFATADNDVLAQSFANDENFFQLRLDPYFGATAKVHADCAASLHELISITANNKRALVHGDISPKNLLVGPTGPLFLDAECAWYGEPAFDAAFCLCHLLAKCLWRPTSSDAFLACFDAFAESYLLGVRWENAEHIESRITRLLAAIMLARVDGKSPLEYLNEHDSERLRNFAKARVLSPREKLKTIRDEWQRELQS